MNHSPDFFSTKITQWFRQHARDLPWRNTTDPYPIWISEVILQQTRVAQGLDYYHRFIKRFPDVLSLAEADENEVLKHWQGLGYYSRARNLHAAAQQIKTLHNGVFPTRYEDVLTLRGVGDYTAAAICSFAYNLPYAVLDGNVYRVLSRVFGIETPINTPKAKKEFTALAQTLLNTKNPSEHNQAIMEFGALQCVPTSPNCSICPLVNQCVAFSSGMVQKLPVKLKKTTIKERYFNYFFVQQGEFTYLKKREANDIWKNLYEFPLIETEEKKEYADLMVTNEFREMVGSANIFISGQPFIAKHILTHRIIHATFYSIVIDENTDFNVDFDYSSFHRTSFLKVPMSDLHHYPVSRLIEMFLETKNS